MRQAAAEGAERAHAHVADEPRRLGQHRTATRELGRLLELVVADERADADAAIVHGDVAQRQRVDVDHDARTSEPIVQDRDEALAACEDLRLVTVLAQQRQRVVEGVRRRVLERVHHPPS
jgi:hypothetical protein